MPRKPYSGRPARAARPNETALSSGTRDHAERDVLTGEVGAHPAAAGQRHGLEDERRPGQADRVGVEDPDERGAEDRAARSTRGMRVRAEDGADRYRDHDHRGKPQKMSDVGSRRW